MGRTACTEPQCLYKGALYLTVELYLYSPYGPYGLYRASVPVQGCTDCFIVTYCIDTTGVAHIDIFAILGCFAALISI